MANTRILQPQHAQVGRCSCVVLPPRSRRQSCLPVRSLQQNGSKSVDEDYIWTHLAFPSYLQSREKYKKEVCRDFEQAVAAAELRQAVTEGDEALESDEDVEHSVWLTIRREAERDAATEPLLSSFLYASILAHDSFERTLAFVLSNRLANAVMLSTQLFETFHEVLLTEPDVREGALADVEACMERDPACTSYSQALLYYKGYHAIQTHRIAHALWQRGQKVMAVALQSRISEVLAVDIHPAARLGHGILLDHGTGVVIGETAVIGNNVSLLQNVTLGGTGKEHGDRHPKISDNVLIGASATVLGNIRVGEGAQIAAGSLVLKPVEPHTMVAGSPAKPVGAVTGNPAVNMQQWCKKLLSYDPFSGAWNQADADAADNAKAAAAADKAAAAAAAAAAPAEASAVAGLPRSKKKRPAKEVLFAAEAAWDALAAKIAETDLVDSKATSSSSSNGVGVPRQAKFHVHANGQKHHGAESSNGTDSPSPAAQAAPPSSDGQLSNSQTQAVKGDGLVGPYERHHQQQQQQQASASASSSQQQQQQVDAWQIQQQQAHAQEQAQPQSKLQQAVAVQNKDGNLGQQQQCTDSQEATQLAAAAAARKRAAAELKGVYGGEVDATIDDREAAKKWSNVRDDPEYAI